MSIQTTKMSPEQRAQAARELRTLVDNGTIDLIWGAEAIALWLDRSVKTVYPALDASKIPGAKKVAGKWCLRPKVFLASFESNAA